MADNGNGVDVFAKTRKRLVDIAPESYRHPLDQQATAALRAVPGFEFAVSKLSRFGIEQMLYVNFLANSVRVTPKQCSRIHALLVEACAILNMPEPALFLSQNPVVNAFALGRERPLMVLHTGLVELLDEEELLGVIAHELGHIHCGHSVYRLMLLLLMMAGRVGGTRLGVGDAFTMPIQMALLEWARKAEFSADRASVLVTQNPEAMFSALFKVTGGSPKIFEQMDREEYLKQAEEFDRTDTSHLDKFYRLVVESGMEHPIPVIRSREVLRYGESDEYKAIIEGRYIRYDKDGRLSSAFKTAPIVCPHCEKEADTSFTFCIHCGGDLKEAIASAQAKGGEAVPVEETKTEEINEGSADA